MTIGMFGSRNDDDDDDYPWKDDEPIGGMASMKAERREKWEQAKELYEDGQTVRGDDELNDMIQTLRERE